MSYDGFRGAFHENALLSTLGIQFGDPVFHVEVSVIPPRGTILNRQMTHEKEICMTDSERVLETLITHESNILSGLS